MRYYEAKFSIQPFSEDACDILAALIVEAGFESFDNNGKELLAYVQTDLFHEELLQTLLNEFPMSDTTIAYTLSPVDDCNWNEAWEQQGFSPIIIDQRCMIYDAHHQAQGDEHVLSKEPRLSIAIEACQAFGTGTHQTTRMVVGMLLDMELKDRRVLDCGCGTGILSIVASKLGASDVVGYDIDEWSVRNSQHNATLNQVDNLTVLEGNSSVLSHVSGLFDVVVANINRNILVEDMPHFADVMQQHAHLIISGFYEEDAPILIERAREFQLHLVSQQESDHWMCLHFQRE